jgi:hypothetical protein
VPTPLNPALLQKAAAAAAAAVPPSASAAQLTPQLTPQMSLAGLMDTLESAAAHEAKVCENSVECHPGS